MEFAQAKEIYLRYRGSAFFMNHDGVDVNIFLDVPHEVLLAWDEEIRQQTLAQLAEPGNYEALGMLAHLGYFEHLDDLLAHRPLGVLWQRCAYLEDLLIYLDCCSDDRYPAPGIRYEPEKLWAALEWVIAEAAVVRRRARSDTSRSRIDAIIEGAGRRLDAVTDADGNRAGQWRWFPLTRTAERVPEATTR